MIRPMGPPRSEGNSGPRSHPKSTYGMSIETAAKIANFHAPSPSPKLRFWPKNPVSMQHRISGIKMPQMAWMMATRTVTTSVT